MTINEAANDQVETDEEIARALQEQFRREAEASRLTPASAPPTSDAFVETLHEARSAQHLSAAQRELLDAELNAATAFESSGFNVDDSEVARRIEQEARDAALAATLARQDAALNSFRSSANIQNIEDPVSREVAQNMLARDQAQIRKERRKRTINNILSLVLGLGFVFLLYWYLRRRSQFMGGTSGNPFDDLSDWFGWEGHEYNEGENVPWYPAITKNGLNLRVLNNLDEKWQDTFYTVINEWDNGTPNSVSFQIERINDPYCRSVYGAMVVCNGDYGMVDWRGINELVIENGYLVASVAKLNDYYLEGRDSALRQYVCCHELGHGLGLAHTDENEFNADLGECMDYTVNPAVNMHPGQTNFEALETMYGTVGGGRQIRELKSYSSIVDAWEKNPANVKWRFLRRTKVSEHYETDLGYGYKIRRTLLLA